MNHWISTLIAERARRLPLVMYIAPPFMNVSACLGGAVGFSSSLQHENGIVWRTSLGVVSGGSVGLLMGLYPYHAASLLLVSDVAHTMRTAAAKKV